MKRKFYLKQMAFTFLLMSGILSPTVFATDGYFSNGYGVRYRMMAGAGVGLHLSPFSVALNPASLVFVGTQYDINLSLFNPNREYTVTGAPSFIPGTFGLAPGTVESDKKTFLIPSIAANWMLGGSEEEPGNMSFGIAIYGNGGMNTTYDNPTFGFQTTGVDLSQLFVTPSFSIKFGGKHSFGVAPILAYQQFQANGVLSFSDFSNDPSKLSNNGHDSALGFGARLGYLGKFTDFLSVGASIQTPIAMGKFEEYAGLFAEGGGFDIPMNWTAGVALQFDKLGIALDVQQILYSQVNSVGNPLLPNLQQNPLGSENGAGFGWEDMTIVRVGASYQVQEGLTIRAGYSYGKQPIPESEVLFNILAPAVIEQHITFGASKSIDGKKEISLFVMHALSNSVAGANPLEMPGQQTIELKMNQWEVGVGFTF